MNYIWINKENIDKEHICCALSNNKDIGVLSKKIWMKDCLEDGLTFIKSEVRGKCFIEYIPAENAWIPINADNYIYIDCFWVSGSLKGKGYSNDLLDLCIKDAKEKNKLGLCILSSKKKKPFLSDPKYLLKKGFTVADESGCGINLMYLPFVNDSSIPKFKEKAKNPKIEEKGFVLYYTSQCPFNDKYVPIIEKISLANNIDFKSLHLQTKKQAQNAPTPCTTYALFYDGKRITNEQQNDKKFLKLVENIKSR